METFKPPNNMIINNKTKDSEKEKEENQNVLLTFKLKFTYDLTINNNINMTLSELYEEISKNYSIKVDEYELFIGNNSINNISGTTKVVDLLNKYKDKDKDNTIKIKTFKNIFDVHKQINDYESFLTENIAKKNEENKKLINEYENIIKELNNDTNLI